MRRMVGMIALLGSGCLSIPPEVAGDGGGDDTIDAGTDPTCGRDPRPAAACHPVSDFTATPYTPGAGFVLRQGVVDDVNADGQADLLIVENTPGSEGIYVLLGPVDPDAPMYHALIDTDLDVGEVEVRQVDPASPCPDLTVFGRTGGNGVVQVWGYDGAGGVMYPGPPLTATIDFEPMVADSPTLLGWARLHDGGDDLLVADINRMSIVHVDGEILDLQDAPERTAFHDLVPVAPNWDSINGIDPTPTMDCSRDRVFIAENQHAHFLIDDEGDGTGDFEGGPQVAIGGGGNPVTLGTARVDLDDVPPDDILTGGTQAHGVYLLAHDGADQIAVTVANGDLGYTGAGLNFWIDGFAVGDLGGGSSPDWVGVDYEPGTAEPRAILVDALSVDGTTLDGDPAQVFTQFPTDYVPRAVVIGDLAGTGSNQAWVLSTDGRLECLRRRTTVAALEACPRS